MAKREGYVCSSCGYESAKWLGRCPSCGQWGSFKEKVPSTSAPSLKKATPIRLEDVDLVSVPRIRVSSSQLSALFGGGLAKASVMLLAGEPGVGKSTFLLQLPAFLDEPVRVLYASGEETEFQVADRARRLGVEGVWFVATRDLEEVLQTAEGLGIELLILDSVQTFWVSKELGVVGGVAQVKAVCERVVEWAKDKGVTVVMVGHVTKTGVVAGPKFLEHMVDVVVYMEGDRRSPLRLIRCVKNRFGPTNNVVLFEMGATGLTEVENPSSFFVQEEVLGKSGTVLSVMVEGLRAFVMEVQALVAPAVHPAAARRIASMYDVKRLYFLLAVLEKHLEVHLSGVDVYLNVPGGIFVKDTGMDLAVALAIYSSFVNKKVDERVVAVGEVGLAGEVRWVRDMDLRLKEAKSFGAKRVLIPKAFKGKIAKIEGLEVLPVGSVEEAVEVLF